LKPYTHLYPQICAWENLERACRRARQGKRGRAPAATFERRLEDNLVALQDELAAHAYQPGAYQSFYIHAPKRRLISAAPFRDRVVHHALCNVIEPLFERRFIFDSYANRLNKGTHRALDRCTYFAVAQNSPGLTPPPPLPKRKGSLRERGSPLRIGLFSPSPDDALCRQERGPGGEAVDRAPK